LVYDCDHIIDYNVYNILNMIYYLLFSLNRVYGVPGPLPPSKLELGRVVHGARFLWGELSMGRVVVGRVLKGLVVCGARVAMGRVIREHKNNKIVNNFLTDKESKEKILHK
jgi:hypothetical protein